MMAEIAQPATAEAGAFRLAASWLVRETPGLFAAQVDRASLWLVVSFAAGVALFFAWTSEPPLWVSVVPFLTGASLIALGRRSLVFLAAALMTLGLGHGAAQLRTFVVRAPILHEELRAADIEGTVTSAEKRPAGNHVILTHVTLPGFAPGTAPNVRLTVPASQGLPAVGQQISLRASVGPVGRPVAPDAFQFQRFLYFQGVGASGFAIGRWKQLTEAPPLDWGDRFHAWTERLRRVIGDRLASEIPGEEGTVSAALINGEQSAIPQDLQEAYRISGIAHILSVSGVHLSLLAGIVFFAVRRGLALVPPIALRFDTKKIAAWAGLAATGFYLVISGMSIPAIRSFLMVATVLIAILVDRKALSLRNVAFAALLLLAIYPDAIFGPSFQMSFLAVLSLIALYEQAWLRVKWRDPDGSIRIARAVGFYVAGLCVTDIVAGGATALLAAYHFNRLPTYSMFTNLLAAPLTSVWIMPAAVVAMIAMPLGLDRIPAEVMGRGVKALDDLARWVATWPGSQVHIQPMPTVVMVVALFGVIFCCLWRGRLRWLGLLPSLFAFIQPAFVPIPDLLVEDSGRVVAVSDTQGHLIIRPGRAGRFVRDVWSGRYTASTTTWPKAGSADQSSGLSCDRAACRLERRGRTVVIANKPDAARDSCGRADVIVVAASARELCASGVIIDRDALKADGSYAVWITAEGIRTRTVRQSDGARAWTENQQPEDAREKPAV